MLDGKTISAGLVLDGVRAWIEDARKKPWMFDQGLWEVEGWLALLSFTDRPAATIDGVDLVLNALPRPRPLERVVSALRVRVTRVTQTGLRYWRVRWTTIRERSVIVPFAWAAEFIGKL